METKRINKSLVNAIKIGTVCVGTYLVNYLIRHLLSVFTPQILESGLLSKEDVALISSVYMVIYASGQLIFGVVGDYVKPKFMVSGGLILSAAGLVLFPAVTPLVLKVIAYGMLGLGLSSMRGPLVKVISENNEAKYSRFICVMLSFVSFVGPFVAGLLVLWMKWEISYYLCAVIALIFAVGSFAALTVLERHGTVVHCVSPKTGKTGGVLGVFRVKGFIAYMFIGMIVEIAASSIDFWIPTYINEHLGFSADVSGVIFSVISFAKAFAPFICLFLLKLMRDRDMHLNFITLGVSAALLLVMTFVTDPWMNIGIYLVARLLTSITSATLWSIYIPSLGKTGKVSSANGILDCSGYAAAALANLAFPVIMNAFGWNGTIISWVMIELAGVAVAIVELTARKIKERKGTE